MKKLVLNLMFLSLGLAGLSQGRVGIPGSQVRKIVSNIVSGQEYELQVLLPRGYEKENKKYPVIYLMDSQWDFPLVTSIYGQQYYDGFVPELIIVGINWGGTNPNHDSLRARDYTPTHESYLPQSGGAEKFLGFMRNELFPYIESNFKADSKRRVMMGCSFGGLVTLYALFTQPQMFSGYVAASPAVGWNRESIYQFEKAFAEREHDSLRLYITVGDVERSRFGFEKFSAHLRSRNYKGLSVHSRVLENTGHSGTKTETYTRGLQYIFQRPQLLLADEVLNRYTGSYRFANGNKVEIRKQHGRLILYFAENEQYPLFANAETEFYSLSEYLKLRFIPQDPASFQLETFNGTQILTKTHLEQ